MKLKFLIFVLLIFAAHSLHASSDGMIITEIMFDPDGSDSKKEWIEIYNNSEQDIDLSGWKFFESGVNHSLAFVDGKTILKSKEFAIIADDEKTFLSMYSNFSGLLIDSSFSLSNSGEELVLKNNKSETQHAVIYSALEESKSGYSLELVDDTWQRSADKMGSPGKKNILNEKEEVKEYPNGITITELFPNPFQSEVEEYIELYNNTDADINLQNWILKDASKTGRYIFPEIIIKAKEYLVIFKKDFKFALNNSGSEIVSLIDPNGKEVSSVQYDGSKKNASFNLKGDTWKWSKFLTPGKANIYNNEPYGKLKLPKDVYEDVYADFSVSLNDADGDQIKVVWDFGDKHKSYKPITRHKYKDEGVYNGSLKITDGSEDIIQNFIISVEEFPHPKVRIVAVNANPEGSDTKNETITIENKSKKKINLKGWSIATGSTSKKLVNHPIKEDIEINKKRSKEITREFSSFSLNNKKGKIELRYPDGEVAHKVKYEKVDGIEEGEIYQKVEGGWEWVQSLKSIKSIKPVKSGLENENEKNISLENAASVIGNQSSNAESEARETIMESEKKNKFIELKNEHIDIEILKVEPKSLNYDGLLSIVDGRYLLITPSEQEHYAITFIKEIASAANSKINVLLN